MTGKFLHTWQEVEGKRLNSPAKGGGAMTGIFTYMTGNWELLGNGLKDRTFPPCGRKWKGRLNSLAKGEGGWEWTIFLHDRKLGFGKMPNITEKWTERQENSCHILMIMD